MLVTIGRLKSKPEVEFQYGGRSFSETGSSYNSAVERDIFTKFGTLRYWPSGDMRTIKLEPEVDSRSNVRHLENFNGYND